MSLENAKRFIEAWSQDQALKEKLAPAREPAEALRLAVKAGSERGLPFTPEEFGACIRAMVQENSPNANAGELSDSQLDQVAGGFGPLLAGFMMGASFMSGVTIGAANSKDIVKSIDVGKLIP